MGALKEMIKEPKNLTPRIKWLRDYYFEGASRDWSNEVISFTTGTEWDMTLEPTTFMGIYELQPAAQATVTGSNLTARIVDVPEDFYEWDLVERRAWFNKEVIVNHVPHDVLPGDLLACSRFNLRTSRCLSKEETEDNKRLFKNLCGVSNELLNRAISGSAPTPGHIIPDHAKIINHGFKADWEHVKACYDALTAEEKAGPKGAQHRAMMTAAEMARDYALGLSKTCAELAAKAKTEKRKKELLTMSEMLTRIPWEGAKTFWEAVMSLWISHALILVDENYPGPGTSFGRMDQYLYPFWKKSIEGGMDPAFGKEILECMWIHCNIAYDYGIRGGTNDGKMAGFGQLFSFSGMGKGGVDLSNDMTFVLFDVIDDMSPILEPKPNVRIHRNTPDKVLDRVVDMLSESQGAPFLINFDERSMAGLMREAKMSGNEHLINLDNVHDYASVGCLENTMVGNDRSETVNTGIYLVKPIEFALNNGKDFIGYYDVFGNPCPQTISAPGTGDPRNFKTFEEFMEAFETQMKHQIKQVVEVYDLCDEIRYKYIPAPYLSLMVKGCAEKGLDVTRGGPELRFCTLHGICYASCVDSLLAIKYLVYDQKLCTMDELIQALLDNWEGHEWLQAQAKNRAPKYGRDDDRADELAARVMNILGDEVWKYKSSWSHEQFRGGMLSWNFWITVSDILPASPDGRKKGNFFSNAICPTNGMDIKGPTSNVNSVGKALGGKSADGGDYEGYLNNLPNGASHTITFSPAMMRDPEHKEKFKSFLRGYAENGGTALQINVLDSDMLRDAQVHPEDYKHLLVRITGYNAYFTTVGRELQNEIIARQMHNKC